jgi:hypothetical protein
MALSRGEMSMKVKQSTKRTELFLVRVWIPPSQDGSVQAEWGGKVQRVVDGEAHYFDDPQTLTALISDMLFPRPDPQSPK